MTLPKMPSSTHSSNVYADFDRHPRLRGHGDAEALPLNGRFQWRPSRLLVAALALLGLLAVVSVLQSDLPATKAWPLAGMVFAYGAWSARSEGRRRVFELVIAGNGTVRIDGRTVEDLRLVWRGPLGFMAWREPDGGLRRRLWLPDTLPAPARRELRLALMRCGPDRRRDSMAR